jgi:type I restriction enzyme S subunit
VSIPKLRFPEFRGSEAWEEEPLKKVIQEYRKKSTIQDEYEVLTSSRGGLVKQKDYYDNTRITDRDNIGFNIIPPNYLTYRSRSDDNLFFFNENKLGITGIISSYYPVFHLLEGDNKFFAYLLYFYAKTLENIVLEPLKLYSH